MLYCALPGLSVLARTSQKSQLLSPSARPFGKPSSRGYEGASRCCEASYAAQLTLFCSAVAERDALDRDDEVITPEFQPVWKSTGASGAPDNYSLSHLSAMTRPSWLGLAVRNLHRYAIEQASRRWRGGRRDESARTRRKTLISTQVPALLDGGRGAGHGAPL